MGAEPAGAELAEAGPAALRVRGLSVRSAAGMVIVSGVDLDLPSGATLGIVGESGSGKTTVLRAIVGLLAPGLEVTGGEVMAAGRDLVPLSRREMQQVRGHELGVVWQDPLAALDPVVTVGKQIAEVVRSADHVSRPAARARAIELMGLVELPRAESLFHAYPHQLSGGQRQRVVIAAALAAGPRVLLADEPTTALDVTVQQQILELFSRLRETLDLALIMVSHDLAVVGEVCENVAIMYGGRIVETGTTREVFTAPQHHYTAALLRSVPSVTTVGHRPAGISGSPPPGVVFGSCSFAPRCPAAEPQCRDTLPELTGAGARRVACHYPVRAGSGHGRSRHEDAGPAIAGPAGAAASHEEAGSHG